MIYNLVIEKPYEHLITVWEELLDKPGEIEGERLSIRKALPQDAFMLDIRDEQKDTFDNSNLDYLIRMHAWLNQLTPMNYTVFHGDKILVMITVLVVLPGVAEISFLTDNNFVKASKLVKFHMIKAFQAALNELPFRRIQAKVKEGFTIGTTFVEKLGFEQEGILKNYGPEDNYISYGLIK
jgi:hypothetical protein